MAKDNKERIKELVGILNRASRAYYMDAEEVMSNRDYDELYDELEKLEKDTGIVLSNSPTRNVGYEVVSELPKQRHPSKMLSLDKTKSREELAEWLDGHRGLLSWKLDGLTVVLTYEDGELSNAVTRGNGEIGEVITGNARCFANLPLTIPHRGRTVLRGEAVITYSDFARINELIGEEGARYKNPRNLCSGSVRQLDPSVTRERQVNFIAFTLVEAEGVELTYRHSEMEWLSDLGFDTVAYVLTDRDRIIEDVERFSDEIEKNDFPSDGLVLALDDIAYGRSLGVTAKFPRDAIAFKWADQQVETELIDVEWSASRTGLLNPIAIFNPVELEGTTVSRASLHNISIMEGLELGLGDTITVYKANMIIPQLADNLTKSNNIEIPSACPVCGGETRVDEENGVRTLLCTNEDCPAKKIKKFGLFVSRDGMNIEGFSEAALEKFISKGLVNQYADIFRLKDHGEEIAAMDGFGEKSFDNITRALERASHTTPARLLYALGIPGIGAANAQLIARACKNNWKNIMSADRDFLVAINGIGEVMADAYVGFFEDEDIKNKVDELTAYLDIDESFEERGGTFDGMTFVITGSLNYYKNRKELKQKIEEAGGSVSGSVSGKTSYLINNNTESTTGKNKKARELNVPVIDEETVRNWLENGIEAE